MVHLFQYMVLVQLFYIYFEYSLYKISQYDEWQENIAVTIEGENQEDAPLRLGRVCMEEDAR